MNVTSVTVVIGPDDDDLPGRCELLGPFALFVQGLLGALALLVLLWKRSREHPQRPLLVWFMDVSKQVLGGVFVHGANLLLSMLSSGHFTTKPTPNFRRHPQSPPPPPAAGDDNDDGKYHSNPCSFYLLNLGIDTTIGVLILLYLLRLFYAIARALPGSNERLVSGYYGDPPRWGWWARQAAIYFAGLMGMKMVVWGIFELFPWLGIVGDWLLRWTEGNRRVQVAFVMFLFPLVMNAFQYYLIDSFIKFSGIDPAASTISPHHTGASPLTSPRESFNYDEETDAEERGLLPKSVPSGNSSKSINSSMVLLPGSRGTGSPGYADGGSGFGERSVGWEEDESTLVER